MSFSLGSSLVLPMIQKVPQLLPRGSAGPQHQSRQGSAGLSKCSRNGLTRPLGHAWLMLGFEIKPWPPSSYSRIIRRDGREMALMDTQVPVLPNSCGTLS